MADREAFDAYVRERWAPLLRTATLLTGDRHAADLVQETLVRAAQHWARVEPATADAYVRRILYTRSVDAWLTYPEYVSELMPGNYQAGNGAVFGVVTDVPSDIGQGETVYVIDRSGLLAKLPHWSWATTGNILTPDGVGVALAPGGQTLLTQEGVVDFSDGSVTGQAGFDLSSRTASVASGARTASRPAGGAGR